MTRSFLLRSLLLACGLLSVVTAITTGQGFGALSGPKLGYLWGAAEGKLRPILGIPGSATIGEPIDLHLEISGLLPLDGRSFLVSSGSPSSVAVLTMNGNGPITTMLGGIPPNPSMAITSRGVSAVALYYADIRRVFVVTGMPSKPKITHAVDVSAHDGPSRMAVSSDGNLLIFAVRQGQNDFVYRWTPSGGPRLLTIAESVSGIAFTSKGDVIVADVQADEVFAIRSPLGSAARFALANRHDGISKPVAVAVSSSDRIYVANPPSTVISLDAAGGVLRAQRCSCEISGFHAMAESIYRLTDRSDRTLFLLDGRQTSSDRILFVPFLRRKP